MSRRLLLLHLLVALCAFQSVAPKRHQQEVEESKAEDAKVLVDPVEDLHDETDDDDLDDSSSDLNEDGLHKDEIVRYEQEDEEEFTGELPFHPVDETDNPTFQDLIVRSRRPSCSNRKCTRWYRGWWSNQCRGPNARAVSHCAKTGKWCCAICETRKKCARRGGLCTMSRKLCENIVGLKMWPEGCRGRWGCCNSFKG